MKRLDLYPHNLQAYEQVKTYLSEYGKAAVIHPTGTGKSFIAFQLALDNQSKKILWLAPSEYIFRLQLQNVWEQQRVSLENVEFHTYAWIHANEQKIPTLKPDFIVFDEFHRAGAQEWGKSIGKLISEYPESKMLGLSATNIRYLDGQRDMADELFDGFVASEMTLCEAMAIGILPHPKYVVSSYSYERKIEEYEHRIEQIRSSEKKVLSQNLLEKLRRALDQAGGLKELFNKHLDSKNKKVIVFCSGIESLYELVAKAIDWFGDIDSSPHIYHVVSNNPYANDDFQSFVDDESDHLKLLYCVDMLNEGIHVDDVDAVVLCRPTISPIIYKQQIGRALAVGNHRKTVVFDLVNNFDSLYSIASLQKEYEAVMNMMTTDECSWQDYGGFEIIDELRDFRSLIEQIQRNLETPWECYYEELCFYHEITGSVKVPKRFVSENGLGLGRWLIRQKELCSRNALEPEKKEKLERLGVIWQSESDQRFDRWFELLCQFKEEHGHLSVPSRYETEEGENLGNWCFNIRNRHRKGKVSQERIDRLDSIGFCWDAYSSYWEEGYAHAKAYFEKEKNLSIPKRYVAPDGYKLGLWISTQRAVKFGRVSGNLTEEKIKKLDQIGMIWNVSTNDKFDDYVAAFVRYSKNHEGKAVPFKYITEDGLSLGQWVYRMKRLHSEGKLPLYKVKVLEGIGFVWNLNVSRWKSQYDKVKLFYDQAGDLSSSWCCIKEHEPPLAEWLVRQKREYNKEYHGRLTEEQVYLLESIGIDQKFDLERGWEKGFRKLEEYVKEHGDALVPTEYRTEDGYELGRWISRTRAKWKVGKLSCDQEQVLRSLGFPFESIGTIRARQYWDMMFDAAEDYYTQNGSVNIAATYVTDEGLKLGQWIAQQKRIRRGKCKHSVLLDESRLKKYDELISR